MLRVVPYVVFIGLLAPAARAQPVFTGNVPQDFAIAGAVIVVDPDGQDVGVPDAFPDAISGFDVNAVWFFHDAAGDTLYVGVQTWAITGDADDDGDPDSAGSVLTMAGGVDTALLGGSESVAVMFDVDGDGAPDIIAGVPGDGADLSALGTYQMDALGAYPGLSFGTLLVEHTGTLYAPPSASVRHLEFTIPQFSKMSNQGLDPDNNLFSVSIFLGSSQDLGFGDDYVPTQDAQIDLCLDADFDGASTCDGDCDDLLPECIEDCKDDDNDGISDCADDCVDVDGDGFGKGDGCPDDCNDFVASCNIDCETDIDGDGLADCADPCIDVDGDGFGKGDGCPDDCNDFVASCNVDCTTNLDADDKIDCADKCVDPDGDGYGVGPDCPFHEPDCLEWLFNCNIDCSDANLDGTEDCAEKPPVDDGDADGLDDAADDTSDDGAAQDTTDTGGAEDTTVDTGSGEDTTDDGGGFGDDTSDGGTGPGVEPGDVGGSGGVVIPDSKPPASAPPDPEGSARFIGGGLSGACSTGGPGGGAAVLALALAMLGVLRRRRA